MKWIKGKIDESYQKRILFERENINLVLLKCPKNSWVPPHRDGVPGKLHFQLNIPLKKAKRGGKFQISEPLVEKDKWSLFRPDSSLHEVTKVEEGCSWFLCLNFKIPAF